ncbi:MAG: hemerythrin family protein [Myxococcales bacterium]|nr:hemerythrin family protein [Myxococcales bacterium]
MQRIEWDSRFELGIEDIDLEHRYFLNLIHRILDEMRSEGDPAHRTGLIEELNAYARFHFISEENMMRRAGYPELDAHREHHRRLTDELSAKQAFLAMQPSEAHAEAILGFLQTWFVEHTLKEDRRFATFLGKKRA